ncbi:MAG TPA: hypothetical protein VGJ93_12010 [Desulfuromonadaceae bacterium]|jgi:hypothetical protein
MTFKAGWLERQLQTATKTVGDWPATKREALTLNREGYSCGAKAGDKSVGSEKKK